MDVEHRTCEVSPACGTVKVNLSMHFPNSYPNNSAPTFVLQHDTSVDDGTQSKFMQVSAFCFYFSGVIWGHLSTVTAQDACFAVSIF